MQATHFCWGKLGEIVRTLMIILRAEPTVPSKFAMLYNDTQVMVVWSPVSEAVSYTMFWCRDSRSHQHCDVSFTMS